MPDITLTIVESAPVNLTIENGPDVNLTIGGGASAYQIWIDAGNTGTEADFLASLVGADGPTYSAGTGIDITGTTITNDAPNVVQTLSIAGQDLTLSGGGGTVAIPGASVAGSDGNIQFKNGSALGASPNLNWNGSALDISADEYALRIISGSNLLKFGNGCFYSCNEIGMFDGDDRAIFIEDFTAQNLRIGTAIVNDFSNGNLDINLIGGAVFSVNYSDNSPALSVDEVSRVASVFGNGVVLPNITITERDATSPVVGQTIFCTDCTATDGSTGVMQVYNGTTWKNAW